jgi:hypothetical protein
MMNAEAVLDFFCALGGSSRVEDEKKRSAFMQAAWLF